MISISWPIILLRRAAALAAESMITPFSTPERSQAAFLVRKKATVATLGGFRLLRRPEEGWLLPLIPLFTAGTCSFMPSDVTTDQQFLGMPSASFFLVTWAARPFLMSLEVIALMACLR